jgi:hypothetical protein
VVGAAGDCGIYARSIFGKSEASLLQQLFYDLIGNLSLAPGWLGFFVFCLGNSNDANFSGHRSSPGLGALYYKELLAGTVYAVIERCMAKPMKDQ